MDFPTEHPSCSKQHAVLQFRYVERRDEWGGRKGGVRPYVIDLESANGTRVNGEAVPESRYVEVRSGDVVRFGESTRLVDRLWTLLLMEHIDILGQRVRFDATTEGPTKGLKTFDQTTSSEPSQAF